MMYDPLIYGKSDLERIVSIEVTDDKAEVFLELSDGTIETKEVPNRYWIVSPIPRGNGWVRLKGDLHYKYGKQYLFLDQFIRSRINYKNDDVFSIYNNKEALMIKDGYTYYKNMTVDQVSILAFDIEATSLHYTSEDKVLIISNTFRKNGVITRKLFAYDEYQSQKEMLEAWTSWVREINPSIIAGHNIYSYDFRYLESAARNHDTSLALGRDGSDLKFDKHVSKFRKDGSQSYDYNKVRCYGRELVDTMFLAIKYDIGRKYESYGLKNIIKQEGMVIEGRVYYDAANIRNTYTIPEEWEKIKQYAIHDGDEALQLFDLMSPSFFYLAPSIPKPFQLIIESASGSQLNAMMLRSYLQNGHSIPKGDEGAPFEGAISFGNPNIYKNVFKVDVASLYPSIMLEYQIFDEDKDPNKNLLTILETFTTERLKNKKLAKDTGNKYYSDLEQAQKIVINSLYGFMGAQGLNFNFPEGAAAVTKYGREILQHSMDWATNKGFTIVNGDTDSISFCSGYDFTEKERKDLLADLNSLFPPRIHWEDDGYYKMVIILRAKNYILWDGKKLKTKGSALKSSTKEAALKHLMDAIIQSIITEKYNYVEIYNNYIKAANNILSQEEMKLWSSKKTLTERTLNSERANETKIIDAIGDSDFQMGDKLWVYFRNDGSLSLIDNFNGDYDKFKLMEKVWKTMKTFENIIDMEQFPKYHLKTKRKLLVNIGIDLELAS